MPATTGSGWFARVAFVECVGEKVALSIRDRLAERGEDADWLLWIDRVDEAAAALGFPVAERQGYGLDSQIAATVALKRRDERGWIE